jgi:hypothetical protein
MKNKFTFMFMVIAIGLFTAKAHAELADIAFPNQESCERAAQFINLLSGKLVGFQSTCFDVQGSYVVKTTAFVPLCVSPKGQREIESQKHYTADTGEDAAITHSVAMRNQDEAIWFINTINT